MSETVVLDIGGTVSPLTAGHEVLFPYARSRIEAWVREDRAPGVVAEVCAVLGGSPGTEEVLQALLAWHDGNVEHSLLKTLHGLIWEQGFADGVLVGQVYPDVPLALADWRQRGTPCWVYSSGSMLAQRLWFSHNDRGDLASLLAGHFDITNAGPKHEPLSYRRIAASIGSEPGEILFLTDSRAELDAAHAAGWRSVGVRRPGCETDFGRHPVVADLSRLAAGRHDLEGVSR